jgi:hypothetical protein
MPTQTTKAKPPAYTENGTADQTDEKGRRALKPSTTKAEINKGVNQKLKGSVGMTEAKPGNAEEEAFDLAHELIRTLATSRDPLVHAKALTEGGNDKHAKPSKK